VSRGLALDVLTEGRGDRDVVFLHGFGASRFTWRYWRPALAARYRLHLVDLKGFGTAARPRDDAYAPRDLAAEVMAWIQGKGLEDWALVGHSMGGGIALHLTLALRAEGRPGPVALVLLGAAAYPQNVPDLISLAARPLVGSLAVTVIPARTLVRWGLQASYSPGRPIPEEAVAGYTAGLKGRRGKWAMRKVAARIDPGDLAGIATHYPEIAQPTLLLWGSEDRIVPPWVGERLHGELPRSALHVFEGCGHVIPEESPEASLDLVDGLLARHQHSTPAS
jgi:pimeloyl-ACP methyl ester carboxylesterase